MKNLPADKKTILATWVEGDTEFALERTDSVVEGFTFTTILGQTIRWNVTQAQKEVAAGHVITRSEIPPDAMREISEANEWTEEGVESADPTLDGIAAPLNSPMGVIYILIDGTHRLVRAMRERRPFFAQVLTDDANRRCIVTADPGMVP